MAEPMQIPEKPDENALTTSFEILSDLLLRLATSKKVYIQHSEEITGGLTRLEQHLSQALYCLTPITRIASIELLQSEIAEIQQIIITALKITNLIYMLSQYEEELNESQAALTIACYIHTANLVNTLFHFVDIDYVLNTPQIFIAIQCSPEVPINAIARNLSSKAENLAEDKDPKAQAAAANLWPVCAALFHIVGSYPIVDRDEILHEGVTTIDPAPPRLNEIFEARMLHLIAICAMNVDGTYSDYINSEAANSTNEINCHLDNIKHLPAHQAVYKARLYYVLAGLQHLVGNSSRFHSYTELAIKHYSSVYTNIIGLIKGNPTESIPLEDQFRIIRLLSLSKDIDDGGEPDFVRI